MNENYKDHFGFDFSYPEIANNNALRLHRRKTLLNYIYTGPYELNLKKETHMFLYVFTERIK